MSIADNIDFARFATSEVWRRFSCRIRRRSSFGNISKRPVPERLILAPHDMLSTDPATALEIYSGRFFLGGHLVELNGSNPFLASAVTLQWQRELHAFKWLRHLEAAQTSLSKHNAQSLIQDWMVAHGKPKRDIAWQEEIAAQRLISWTFHCPPIVETADAIFYRNWLKSFSIHIRYLKRVSVDAPDGFPRLICRIALSFAAICISDQESYLRNAAKFLDDELLRQILPDGGHISRNAALLPQILSLLLPLRQSYVKLGLAPSQIMISTIDRMMAALKFSRLGDGNIARFNGVSTTPGELVAAILRHDDSKGAAPSEAFASGYQRIEKGETVLLADTGKITKGEISKTAHAGTLSFEFSCGKMPIVVNCGQPFVVSEKAMQAARITAAHSAAVINGHSSSKIYTKNQFGLYGQILSRPGKVICKREEHANSTTITTNHDGYLRQFGVIHHRLIGMGGDGFRILGEDKFTGPAGNPLSGNRPVHFTIRFHLHPSLSAGKTEDGRNILILGGNGIAWKFTCVDVVPELDESIFFASHNGLRRSRQIVLNGDALKVNEIRWVFERQLQESAELAAK